MMEEVSGEEGRFGCVVDRKDGYAGDGGME
jgi:hypothetical protein